MSAGDYRDLAIAHLAADETELREQIVDLTIERIDRKSSEHAEIGR